MKVITPMRVLRYLWALPTTTLGLVLAPLAVVTAGGLQIVEGMIEVHGGAIRWLLRYATAMRGGASAMTLGHVVLGLDRRTLEKSGTHERIHVRQCERWGPLFIPTYLLASLAQLLRGRSPYFDNPFEREAYGRQDTAPLADDP